tara:strand:- start:32 stop:505 length:474 start_codon:yes stop_codon:yes gene_type:complete
MEIPGYEGLYYIEPNGDIYSQDRIVKDRFWQSKKISPYIMKNGYKALTLYDKNNQSKHFLIHRLLAIVYIPNPNNYECVNHKDCNRQNNNLNNLEWCTRMYNTQSINTSRKFGYIRLTKSNTYKTEYNSNGKRHFKNFKTEKEAQDYLDEIERMLLI